MTQKSHSNRSLRSLEIVLTSIQSELHLSIEPVILPVTRKLISILPAINSSPVSHIIRKISRVRVSVFPFIKSLTHFHVISPLAFVRLVFPYMKLTMTFLLSERPLANVESTIHPRILAMSVRNTFFKITFVGVAIDVSISSSTIDVVELERTFI